MNIIRLMRGLYKYIIMIIIFTIVQVFSELYLPTIMSKIVDVGIFNSNNSYIISNSIIMFLIGVLALISNIIVIYSTAKFSSLYGYKIRKSMYNKINSFSKKEINKFGAATLITRSTNNVNNIVSIISFGLRLLVFAPIMGIGASIMGYKAAPSLSFIVLISVLILILFISIIFIIVFPKFEVAQKIFDKLNSSIREILSGIRVIKAFNKEKYFKRKFNKINNDNMSLNMYLNKILYLVQPFMMLVIDITTIVVVYLSTGYLENSTLMIGSLIAFIQYLSIVLSSFLMILIIILNIPRTVISFKRINEVLNTEVSIKNNGKLKLNNLISIEFKDVCFKYEGANNYVLKDISFKINEGESIGIIGSSGSGKTTIINLLLRHIEPTSGEIYINGIDIREYDILSLRDIFAYTPQKAVLFKGTIYENLVFDKNIDYSEVDNALKVAAIKDFVDKKEEKYEYRVEQSSVNLSGGEKQRLTITRALLNSGECLILDDSLSAIDYITDKKIRSYIKKEYKDKMIILVTQRVGTIKDSDKIIVLDEGKIESIGDYDYLCENSPIFNEFIDSQRREV